MPHGVSVIIPTLNEEKYLPNLLVSLQKVRLPIEIIVVDAKSEDNTRGVIERHGALFENSIRHVESPQRAIGFQRNLGAAHAKHEILMFCDADIVFTSPESFEKIVSEFVEHQCAVAAPVMTGLETRKDIQRLYRRAYKFQRLLLLFKRPYFAGSCMITTKKVFSTIGGFDISIPLGEDIDYSLRASRVGPHRLIETPIYVSGRRIIKYGYGWIYKELPNVIRLLLTGRVRRPEKIFYPFGDFGDMADNA